MKTEQVIDIACSVFLCPDFLGKSIGDNMKYKGFEDMKMNH
jgi:hypothetical protein